MSKIDKLSIMGIRSFPQNHGETITFYTPLTLIVGVNGSGKTTIVECLKYASTGFQPPNTKGGAFIHDPKLTGEKEVMAQVKMQFRDTKGARMVMTRSLQLTVKKTTRTMKTLEGSLLIDRHGERSTISTRVAELDSLMPQYLGVGPAVLDNVIFCHQDESLWPLSEPAALKKKFDEIFEAQKYTKAIDNIKAIRKKQNEELGKYKIMEQHAKEDRDRADKARKQSEKLSTAIELLRDECNDLQAKIDEAQARADRLWRDSESYARVIGALEGKRIEARSKQSIISGIKEHLKEVPESDEWLERTLEQFATTLSEYEEERDFKRESWLEWKEELERLNAERSEKLAEKGRYEHDKEEYERQLERRKAMIKDAATRHQLRGYDDLSEERLVEEFLGKIKRLSREQSSALEKDRAKADSEKQEAVISINRLTERKAALQESKVTARHQVAQNDREASEYQHRVDQIRVNEASRAVIESRINDVETKLQTVRSTAQTASWDAKLREANGQIRSLEDETARLNDELVQNTKRAGEVARLAHLKQELKETKKGLETLMSAHSDRITQLVGGDWTPSTIERVHRSALDEASSELTNVERTRDGMTRDMEQLQFKQKTVRDEINQKEAEANGHRDAVRKVLQQDIENYDDALEKAQEEVEFARNMAKGYGGMVDYLRECIAFSETESKPACGMCSRAFKSTTDPNAVKMRKKLEGMIAKYTTKATDVDLPAVESRYQTLLQAGTQLKSRETILQQHIPALEKEWKSFGSQREALVNKIEKQDKIVLQRHTVRKDIESISRTVSSIDKCEADLTTFNSQIQELSTKQSQQGNIKTLEDIREEITTANESIRTIKRSTAQLTSDQNTSKNQIHEMELEMKDLKGELSTALSQLEKKANLLSRVEEFKNSSQKQRDAIDKADRDIEALEPHLSTAQAKHEDIVQRWTAEIAELTKEANQLSDTVNGLNLLNDQINSYTERDGSHQLQIVKREIGNLDQSIAKATASQTEVTKQITQLQERLHDSENTRRQYSDNLRYRRETQALDQLNEEIQELASRNAEVDRDRFSAESKMATRAFQKYAGEREGRLGEMKSKDMQLTDLLRDFETDFKDAPARYQEAHIKVATTKAAVADLAVYGNALDNAIMKFHGIKMAQVNDIMADLWTKTYKGTDVDKIMISSDHDGSGSGGGSNTTNAATSTTTTRGRSYNYRVVMVKQGVEMDMRGRCSAGQKVLASIIIRLALADVFSQDCGLIALDEPTTNLDHANIISLAESLHDIIKERQRQSNFQLIVITHDEDFLRAMNCGDFADYYYRVSRDQKADSIVERQDIVEVER